MQAHKNNTFIQVPLDMIDACGLGEGLLELARKSYRVVIASMRGNDANRRVCVHFVRTFQQHVTVDCLSLCLFFAIDRDVLLEGRAVSACLFFAADT